MVVVGVLSVRVVSAASLVGVVVEDIWLYLLVEVDGAVTMAVSRCTYRICCVSTRCTLATLKQYWRQTYS
jgi:hypothetical protein